MFGSPSDAVGPGLNLFGSAKHYSTGRSPATGSFQEKNNLKKNKINFGGMNYVLYLCVLKTKTL
jgi:hypothetical protein